MNNKKILLLMTALLSLILPLTSAVASAPESQLYDELLNKYRTAIAESWDGEKLISEDLSLLLLETEAEDVGYCILDIDQDGSDELLIGANAGEAYPDRMIFDLYTLQDGKVLHIFDGQPRNRFYLYQDEAAEGIYFIYNENSSSAFQSGFLSMQLMDGVLQTDQHILYDAEADDAHPWFACDGMDESECGRTPMEESLAQDIIDAYRTDVIDPPFSALLNGD